MKQPEQKSDPLAMLSSWQAARYLGVTRAVMERMRRDDRQAIAEKRPTSGPRFTMMTPTYCVYRREDLDAYLQKKLEEREREVYAASKARASKASTSKPSTSKPSTKRK